LTTDTSVLTAIGNDYGFEKLFDRQIEALGSSGDVLVVFSTSGASQNIRAAVDKARAKKLKVIVMTGANGTALAKKADVAIVVPSVETARIQEIHGLVYHAWCECIDSKLSSS
jgi:D-sedoheptulose 7-phosphate isomerase